MVRRRYGDDIHTEPANVDVDTRANLGPLARLAGRWRGTRGVDVKPNADGPEAQAYLETIGLEPIDPQTNGPQLPYGLRYHQHVVKPGEPATYHAQVGYRLSEPAPGATRPSTASSRSRSSSRRARPSSTGAS